MEKIRKCTITDKINTICRRRRGGRRRGKEKYRGWRKTRIKGNLDRRP